MIDRLLSLEELCVGSRLSLVSNRLSFIHSSYSERFNRHARSSRDRVARASARRWPPVPVMTTKRNELDTTTNTLITLAIHRATSSPYTGTDAHRCDEGRRRQSAVLHGEPRQRRARYTHRLRRERIRLVTYSLSFYVVTLY